MSDGPLAINAFDRLLAFVRDIAVRGPQPFRDEAVRVLADYDSTTLAAFHRRLLGFMHRLEKKR